MIRKLPPTIFLLFVAYFLLLSSCKKDSFITSGSASLSTSADTLKYDTVFTQTGSITQSFMISNDNDQKLLLSKVKLMGGSASSFKININGIASPEVDNITIAANDSMYVFVTVNINPNNSSLPFIVRDSILINYNGNNKYVQLQAYGQNAHFLKGNIISTNTIWPNDLPYVILDSLQIAATATLTIQQGCRVYAHANAPILVDGTLIVNATKKDSVIFTGDRLDIDYKDLPASWPGIFFRAGSSNNILTHAIIKNANQGLIVNGPSVNGNPKLILHKCIIDNSFNEGIRCTNTNMQIDNSLISNCGSDVVIAYGGNYTFTNCTIVGYSNQNVTHKNPVMQISDVDTASGLTSALNANIINSIFWGDYGNVADEITVIVKGNNAHAVKLDHCLYKVTNDPLNTDTVAVIKNENPSFDSINVNLNTAVFDFHITKDSVNASPAIAAGKLTTFPLDLDDHLRTTNGLTDIGCYQKQ